MISGNYLAINSGLVVNGWTHITELIHKYFLQSSSLNNNLQLNEWALSLLKSRIHFRKRLWWQVLFGNRKKTFDKGMVIKSKFGQLNSSAKQKFGFFKFFVNILYKIYSSEYKFLIRIQTLRGVQVLVNYP